MTGVEILATQEVAVAWANWNWASFLGVIGLSVVLSAFFSIMAGVVDGRDVGLAVFIGVNVISLLLFGPIVGASTGEPTEHETQYKVTITDEVPMNDFLERYDIITQEGKIYTVRERNEK